MTIDSRNALFIIAGAAAGFLSGLLSPLVFGVRGAILGALLSGAVVYLRQRLSPPGNPPPGVRPTWILGLVTAVAATALMAAWHLLLPEEGRNVDFQMTPLSVPMRFAASLCYTVPLLMFYRERMQGRARAWAWFFGGPVLGALIRGWGYHQIGTIPFNLALGALPFLLLWLLAARLADPAWTPERRQKLADSAPAHRAGDPPAAIR